jgi:hypothetical protein
MKITNLIATLGLSSLFCTQSALPTFAADTLQGGVSHTKVHSGTYLQQHPKVKGAAVGAVVGTGAGAVAGLISGKGTMRGAAIGAGTGTGIGLIQTSQTMKRHGYLKDAAIGTLGGAGLGLAVSKGHGTGKRVMTAGAVGGALGLGTQFLKKQLSH